MRRKVPFTFAQGLRLPGGIRRSTRAAGWPTMQTHLSHIPVKLGARSRVEIMREAVEHPATREPASA